MILLFICHHDAATSLFILESAVCDSQPMDVNILAVATLLAGSVRVAAQTVLGHQLRYLADHYMRLEIERLPLTYNIAEITIKGDLVEDLARVSRQLRVGHLSAAKFQFDRHSVLKVDERRRN